MKRQSFNVYSFYLRENNRVIFNATALIHKRLYILLSFSRQPQNHRRFLNLCLNVSVIPAHFSWELFAQVATQWGLKWNCYCCKQWYMGLHNRKRRHTYTYLHRHKSFQLFSCNKEGITLFTQSVISPQPLSPIVLISHQKGWLNIAIFDCRHVKPPSNCPSIRWHNNSPCHDCRWWTIKLFWF